MAAGETLGLLLLLAPLPVAWMWVGARVYDVTGSVALDGTVVLGGFIATAIFGMSALQRLDVVWVAMRRRAGHDQAEGALTRIVVVSFTLGLVAFWIWFHILSNAFIIPFMPYR